MQLKRATRVTQPLSAAGGCGLRGPAIADVAMPASATDASRIFFIYRSPGTDFSPPANQRQNVIVPLRSLLVPNKLRPLIQVSDRKQRRVQISSWVPAPWLP